MLLAYDTSQTPLAYDVKGSERWTYGDRPVDLYQVGSYGSCLSGLRSRLLCALEGEFVSKGAVKMGAVKSFQGGNHINKKAPASFAQSPLPLESFLHIQTWHPQYPTSGYHYALEFNVSFAGVAGIAFNTSTLSQHRWNPCDNWSTSIAQTDLLQMYDKRGVVESTLRAMGLDHTRVPVTCNPDYRHTAPEDEEAIAKAHADRTRAIMSGETRHNWEPTSLRQRRSSRPVFRCATAASRRQRSHQNRACNERPACVDCKQYRHYPVSRQASRDAFLTMENNPQGFTMGEWCAWYLSEEVGADLFQQHFQ